MLNSRLSRCPGTKESSQCICLTGTFISSLPLTSPVPTEQLLVPSAAAAEAEADAWPYPQRAGASALAAQGRVIPGCTGTPRSRGTVGACVCNRARVHTDVLAGTCEGIRLRAERRTCARGTAGACSFVAFTCTLLQVHPGPGRHWAVWAHAHADMGARVLGAHHVLSPTCSRSDMYRMPRCARARARVPPRGPAEPTAAPRHPATALAPARRQRDKWELSQAPCLLLTFGNATVPWAALRRGERAHRDCRSPPPINLLALTKAGG